MADKTQFNPALFNDKSLIKIKMESDHSIERLKIERGWLGQLWGISSSVPNNVAALVAIGLIIAGIIYTIVALVWMPTGKELNYIKDFWSIISPLITLAIGYLFGHKTSKTEES